MMMTEDEMVEAMEAAWREAGKPDFICVRSRRRKAHQVLVSHAEALCLKLKISDSFDFWRGYTYIDIRKLKRYRRRARQRARAEAVAHDVIARRLPKYRDSIVTRNPLLDRIKANARK